MKKILFLALLIQTVVVPGLSAVRPAEDLLRSRLRTPLLRTEGSITGEGVCWHAAYNMGQFMSGFRNTDDTAYLDAAIKYYDALIEKMHTSPDGYKGWVGPYIYDEDYICDVHIGDAILINHMLDFSETVLKHDDKDIKDKYDDKAKDYLHLAKKHLIEKWDKRGTWHEDGPYGAYASWDQYLTRENLDEWRTLPATKSTLSLPFNKQNSMGIACLRIYRITGEDFYRQKALKIFNFMKSRMCLYNDHYVWNYWEPFGKWDIQSSEKNQLRHWVNVHPYRNYQAGEIHEIVEAYHSGLTFTKQDIQRIINTNLKVMWNGDKDDPKWNNSSYAVQMKALGEIPIKEPPGGHFDSLAGTLWTGLDDFSETIRELTGRKYNSPVSFEREYQDLPVTKFQRPFNSNHTFSMVAAIPAEITKEKLTYLVSQSRIGGNVDIELYSDDGKKRIKTIRKREGEREDRRGLIIYEWEAQDILAGDYRIRWTVDGEFREFPVTIQ